MDWANLGMGSLWRQDHEFSNDFTPRRTAMLTGKNVIVTGSTSGIGFAIATAFAAQGCNIMLNGFAKPEEVEQVKNDIKKFKVKVEYSGADVTKADEVEKMVGDTVKAFGSLDILINNAGIQFTAPIDTFPNDKWQAILATNLSAAFYATKLAVTEMRKTGWGRIVNTASVHGLVGSIEKAAYVAAKHGIVGLTKVTALETGKDKITCNAICPGWVLTPLVQKQLEDRAKKEGKSIDDMKHEIVDEKMVTHEFVQAEDIGALAVFLCGPNSASITGSAITIDGGWTAE
jgi:3-hydroxybutyrate dehydrogenase